MKVLVLGGTGAIGLHLINLLSNNGIETIVTTRKNRKSENEIRFVQGNASDIDFLQVLLKERWDAIIDFMVYKSSSFTERVEMLLNGTEQYLFLSSGRVYADSESPLTETSARLLDVSRDREFLNTDEYALTKARQEDILKNSGCNNWTIVRPYITYNENRLQLGLLEKEEWLYRALKDRTIVFIGDISKTTTLTYGFDVAKCIFVLLGNPKAKGQIYNITTSKCITWDEVLSIYSFILEKHLGRRPKVLLQNVNVSVEKVPYQLQYDRMFNRIFENSKIGEFINVNNFLNPEIGIKKCLNEFLRQPQFREINWRKEALRDRITDEKTPIKEIADSKQKIKYFYFRYLS